MGTGSSSFSIRSSTCGPSSTGQPLVRSVNPNRRSAQAVGYIVINGKRVSHVDGPKAHYFLFPPLSDQGPELKLDEFFTQTAAE